jgi:hypothetical protein
VRGRAAIELFDRLRSSLVGGRWESVYGMLSARLRGSASAGGLAEHLYRNGAALRKAYRDAAVTRVLLNRGEVALSVDWGRQGFAFTELRVVCEGGEPRFDTVPWGRHLVGRARGERLAQAASRCVVREHQRRKPGGSLSVAVVFILCVIVLPGGFLIQAAADSWPWYMSAPLVAALLLGGVCALVWSPGRRWKRSSRGPDARPLR